MTSPEMSLVRPRPEGRHSVGRAAHRVGVPSDRDASFVVVPGRPLNDLELASYHHLPHDLASAVRIHEIPALPGRYVGLTLGRHVFLAEDVSDNGDSALLAHELVHVRQWREQGHVRFGLRYLVAFLRTLPRTRSWNASYRAIPAEVEARAVATAWAEARRSSGSGPVDR